MDSYFAHRPSIAAPASAEETQAFHPLFSVLGAPGSMEKPAPLPQQPRPVAAPQVEIEQANGRVTKIVVTCKCCERIELECEY